MFRRTPVVPAFILLVMVVVVTGCGAGKQVAYQPPEVKDFSRLSWTEAFDSMHEKMSKEYAFTEWRGIDWEQMKAKFRPRIEKAEASGDRLAYYMALREYLFSIPDGHVGLIAGKSFNDDGLGTYQKEVGGGFGLTVAKLDDGRLIANWVKEGGPAASAGMEVGAQIIKWGGKPAAAALNETSTIWSILPQATDAGLEYEHCRFMVRAPVGTSRQVTFKNPRRTETSNTSIVAVDDGMETLTRTDAYGAAFSGNHPERMVESRELEGGVGYIKVFGEGDLKDQPPTIEHRAVPGRGLSVQGLESPRLDNRHPREHRRRRCDVGGIPGVLLRR